MNRLVYCLVIIALVISSCSNKRTNWKGKKHVVAFYNLENLFDTIDQENVIDEEFTPGSFKKWDSKKYNDKLNHLGRVISELGSDQGFKAGPTVMGLCEIENRNVVRDLISTKYLKDKNYKIIHYDSPDKRGIDVAFIYKPEYFKIISSKKFPLIIYDKKTGERVYTRDQLLINGVLEDDSVYFIINHWPSRYGGQERSIPSRISAAKLSRHIIDSLLTINSKAKIMLMGDLNDNPIDISVKQYLNTTTNKKELADGKLYNPLELKYKKHTGTLYYKGKWDLFDQMIMTNAFVDSKGGFVFKKAFIFKKPYLIQQDGKYKGYLLRTFGGRKYLDGYSDHLPVYSILKE